MLWIFLVTVSATEPTCADSFVPPTPRSSYPFGDNVNHTMTYRFLGNSGLKVSSISYGAWLTFSEKGQIGVAKAVDMMNTAIDHGINFFDNAAVYGSYIGESEYIMGLALKKIFATRNVLRSDLIISTKLYRSGEGPNYIGLSRKHLLDLMRQSLKNLQLEYVDLVYCHRPDPSTPLEETVRAMNHMLDRGWAYYWGTSEWPADMILRAHEIALKLNLVGPLMEQPLYNVFERARVEQEYLPVYAQTQLGLTIYSPLAEGILAGRYFESVPDDSRAAMTSRKFIQSKTKEIEAARMLQPLAKKVGCTLGQLALAWCLKNPRVSSVIMGASKPEQIIENAKAIDCVLSAEVMDEIETTIKNYP